MQAFIMDEAVNKFTRLNSTPPPSTGVLWEYMREEGPVTSRQTCGSDFRTPQLVLVSLSYSMKLKRLQEQYSHCSVFYLKYLLM